MTKKESKFKIILYIENKDFEVKKSKIHGFGLFSVKEIKKGTDMGPVFISEEIKSQYISYLGNNYDQKIKSKFSQTSAVRYINHDNEKPNLKFYKLNNQIISAKTTKNIKPGEEITTDYKVACKLTGVSEPEWLTKLETPYEKKSV